MATDREAGYMQRNQDTLFRQWHMLRLIPRHPRKITVQDIQQALDGQGFTITHRSIQRDLNDLSEIFPLLCDSREKPYGWSWQRDAANFDLPSLTTSEALTLVMVEQHLHNLLPVTMLDQMQPYFLSARKRLDMEPKPQRGRAWLEKVRTVPPTQPLIPPKIDSEVQRTISDALLHERQVSIQYKRRGQSEPVEYRIHPLALIQRGSLLYLYCRIFDYDDARTLALHRITSATMLDDRVKYPAGYSLDRQVELGTWGFGPGRNVQLELKFKPGSGDHLYETPLSLSQSIEALPEGGLKVVAVVPDTPQLIWWLLGFGDNVEVIAPSALRETVTRTVLNTAKLYATGSDSSD